MTDTGPGTGPSTGVDGLLRELAPRAVGAVARRYGDFSGAEDAVQEALLAATSHWPDDGIPDDPLAWLVRTASRRLVDQYRRDDARRRREDVAASWSIERGDATADAAPAGDDSLVLMFLCCHPSLTPNAAIPLTLRAVAGLTTREIATAFLVPEATMAQRISRAKAKLRETDVAFRLPDEDERPERVRSVLHVLYLLFNEGYASSSGPDLARTDLSSEAIRLARGLRDALPDEPEVEGLLALLLLTDARRGARTDDAGQLVPLAEQDRSRWDRRLITEGLAIITAALRRGRIGEYQLQASIAAVHDQAARYEDTNWSEIVALYGLLERLAGNPMVTLNRAIAVAMVDGPAAGLVLLDGLEERLGDHHRLHSARAHLHELAGDVDRAAEGFRAAAARTDNQREQHYLLTKAARLHAPPR